MISTHLYFVMEPVSDFEWECQTMNCRSAKSGGSWVRRKRSIVYAVAVCSALMVSGVDATGVYKWVDPTGKVHYSENPPRQGAASKLAAPAPSSANEPPLPQGESIHSSDGRCLTVKCMADEMEADRLKREQEYERQRAENERYAQKQSGTQPPTSPAGLDGYWQYWRTQCEHGQCGSSSRGCDDMKKLQDCAQMKGAERSWNQQKMQGGPQ